MAKMDFHWRITPALQQCRRKSRQSKGWKVVPCHWEQRLLLSRLRAASLVSGSAPHTLRFSCVLMGIQCKQYKDDDFKCSQAQWDRQAGRQADFHGGTSCVNTNTQTHTAVQTHWHPYWYMQNIFATFSLVFIQFAKVSPGGTVAWWALSPHSKKGSILRWGEGLCVQRFHVLPVCAGVSSRFLPPTYILRLISSHCISVAPTSEPLAYTNLDADQDSFSVSHYADEYIFKCFVWSKTYFFSRKSE